MVILPVISQDLSFHIIAAFLQGIINNKQLVVKPAFSDHLY
jgi:hypothetical protein